MTRGYNSKNYREIPPLPLRDTATPRSPVVRKPIDTTCQHRGDSLGTINCGCGSVNRETEVFACDLFAACTLTALGGKAGWLKLGIKERPIYCATCEERKP